MAETNAASETNPVVLAIHKIQEDLSNGVVASVIIDTDNLREMDEMDMMAIEHFFSEED